MGEPVPDGELNPDDALRGLLGHLRDHEVERSDDEGPVLAGRYEILGSLGEGGMGSISLARDLELGRNVAIKRISGDLINLAKRARFETEAQAAGRLRHPNVIQTHELLTNEHGLFLVMEHVPGVTLADRLTEGALPNEETRKITLAICRALLHAHGQQVLHRDLKPDNIMLADDGRILLIDFGLAKRIDSSQALTKTGQFMGTPHYVPPEQISDSKTADARADLYGLGACLYHMLTGRPPFEADDFATLIFQVVNDAPRAPRRVRPDADPLLAAIALRCLKKTPSDRFANANEMLEALEGNAQTSSPRAGWIALGLGVVFVVGLAGSARIEGPTPASTVSKAPRAPPAPPVAPPRTPVPTRRVHRQLVKKPAKTLELGGRPYGKQDRGGLGWGTEGQVVVAIRRKPEQLTLWDLSRSALQGSWREGFDRAAIGPRGKQVALATGQTIRYFPDFTSDAAAPTLLTPSGWPANWTCDAIAFSPRGTQLVVASEELGIALFDLPSGTRRQWIEAKLYFRSCALLGDERYLLAGFGGGYRGVGGVGLWDVASGALIERQVFPGAATVLPLGGPKDERRVALGGKSPYVGITRFGPDGLADPVFLDGGGPPTAEFGGAGVTLPQAHAGKVKVTALAHADGMLYTAAEGPEGRGELRAWDLSTLKLHQTLDLRSAPVRLVARAEGVLVLTRAGRVLLFLRE